MGTSKVILALLYLAALVFTLGVHQSFIEFSFSKMDRSASLKDAYEVDNSFTQYSIMTVTTSIQFQSRSLAPAGDNDYIRFHADGGNRYIFYTEGSVDTCGYLYDSNQNALVSDDNSGIESNFRIEYTITSSGYYFLRIQGHSDNTIGSYTLYYKFETESIAGDSYEPDNDFTQYSTMDVTSFLAIQFRSLEPSGDNDYIRFQAYVGNTYVFYTDSSMDTFGYVYDSAYNLLVSKDEGGTGNNFKIEYTIRSDGYYFLRIRGYYSTTQGPYTLFYRYQTSGNYTVTTAFYSWIDAVTGGTKIADSDDTYSQVTLPFAFTFYGSSYSSVYVCSNGILTFGSGTFARWNTAIPDPSVPNSFIAPFWDDLNPNANGSGKIYWKSFGTYFAVTWESVYLFTSSSSQKFQVILYDTGVIVFQYHTLHSGYTCTVGVENESGTVGVAYTDALYDGLAVQFIHYE